MTITYVKIRNLNPFFDLSPFMNTGPRQEACPFHHHMAAAIPRRHVHLKPSLDDYTLLKIANITGNYKTQGIPLVTTDLRPF